MKKLLLATTALGLFAAGAASAAGPVVTVGGFADFQVGSGNQEDAYQDQLGETSIYARELHTRTDTNVHFKVDAKADNGLGYGAYIELNADTTANDSDSSANDAARRTYLYVESGFGRVEAGSTGDAGNALKVDASTFARATGGVAGDFYKYVDLAGADFAILPGLPTAAGLPGEANVGYVSGSLSGDTHNARANANKVSYYTPRIQGLQAGLSFTPDQDERGTASGFAGASDDGSFINVWNGGLNYQGQFDALTLNAAATGETGEAKDDGVTSSLNDDLQAYNLGLSVGFAGFTVGGSWTDAPEIGGVSADDVSLQAYTLGGAYEFGPFGASLTYYNSTVENGAGGGTADAEFQNVSVGADYKLAPGLMPYVEVSFFDTDDNTTGTDDNSGTVFIVGTQLTF